MAKKGKKYRAAREKIEAGKLYTPRAGIELVKELASANFDETVEAHFLLGIDTRQADQQLRGSISLPNGIGKDVRVLVFAEGEKAREAEEAGADIVGSDDLVKQIQDGFVDFDAAVATPDMMKKVGRLGKALRLGHDGLRLLQGPVHLRNDDDGGQEDRKQEDGRKGRQDLQETGRFPLLVNQLPKKAFRRGRFRRFCGGFVGLRGLHFPDFIFHSGSFPYASPSLQGLPMSRRCFW